MSTLEGCGDDFADYGFYDTTPEDDREGIEPYEGLRVRSNYDFSKYIIVSYEEVLELMEKYKITYLEKNPDRKDEVEKYIDDFKKNAKLK
ncbi:MAG: hypothetical protein MJ246_06370 [Clostridia bacterium]|nr:hypothetical protein [Clostridia bacterium]